MSTERYASLAVMLQPSEVSLCLECGSVVWSRELHDKSHGSVACDRCHILYPADPKHPGYAISHMCPGWSPPPPLTEVKVLVQGKAVGS
jgi:hypothetical protein